MLERRNGDAGSDETTRACWRNHYNLIHLSTHYPWHACDAARQFGESDRPSGNRLHLTKFRPHTPPASHTHSSSCLTSLRPRRLPRARPTRAEEVDGGRVRRRGRPLPPLGPRPALGPAAGSRPRWGGRGRPRVVHPASMPRCPPGSRRGPSADADVPGAARSPPAGGEGQGAARRGVQLKPLGDQLPFGRLGGLVQGLQEARPPVA